MQQSTPQNADKMFAVDPTHMDEAVEGRTPAIEAAKERSRGTGRPIHVERKDGRERMEFRRGELRTYVYETRPKRRRRRS